MGSRCALGGSVSLRHGGEPEADVRKTINGDSPMSRPSPNWRKLSVPAYVQASAARTQVFVATQTYR